MAVNGYAEPLDVITQCAGLDKAAVDARGKKGENKD